MKILLVGGLFGKPESYQKLTPNAQEALLARGYRALGHDVTTLSHYASGNHGRYDIVHVHHLAMGAMTAALDASASRLVFTLHNEPRSVVRRAALRFVIRRCDAVISLAQSLEATVMVRTRGDIVSAVIPPGVPMDLFWWRQPVAPSPGEPWKLVYAGQLIPSKRVDMLIDALHQLTATHDVELYIASHVGYGRPQLQEYASRLGVGDRVHWLGTVAQEELGNLFRSAHVGVLASEAEFVPSFLTEVMACGTPVVAAEVGAVREQVGSFGITFPPGDSAALCGSIVRVIDDYERHCRSSGDMAARVRRRCSVEAMVGSHLEVYERVLLRAGTRRSRIPRVRSLLPALALRVWTWRRRKRADTVADALRSNVDR